MTPAENAARCHAGISRWAKWPWQRCRARRERYLRDVYWGRCDLRKGHEGPHALERGMDVVYFREGDGPTW